MDRILIAVVVRSNSQRLANKWALPIAGIPALGLLVSRYQFRLNAGNPRFWSSLKHEFVICTSSNSDDDMIARYASYLGVDCFRGDSQSVALRLTDAAKRRGYDYVMRLTGDNPLVDFHLIEELIDYNRGESFDYSVINRLPVGVSGEIFSVDLLRQIVSATSEQPGASEYLTFFISENPLLHLRIAISKETFSEIEVKYNFGMDNRADYLFLLNLISRVDPISCGVSDLVEAVKSLISHGQLPPQSSSRSRDELPFNFRLENRQ